MNSNLIKRRRVSNNNPNYSYLFTFRNSESKKNQIVDAEYRFLERR